MRRLSSVLFLSTSAAGVIRRGQDITISPAAQVLINRSGHVSTFVYSREQEKRERISKTLVLFNVLYRKYYEAYLE